MGWIIVPPSPTSWLLVADRWTMRSRAGEAAQGDVTGHTWDGDLQEYNNPLPRWWLWLFYITLIFGAGLPGPVPGPRQVPGLPGLVVGHARRSTKVRRNGQGRGEVRPDLQAVTQLSP